MTTLITGATGFIGRRLVATLIARGHAVRAAVREADPSLPAAQVAVPRESTSIEAWRALVRGCDTVVHLIARAHILDEHDPDPLPAYRSVNTEMTRACASAAALEGVRRFVFVSSIGVHGNASVLQPIQADDPVAPHSPYAISKLEAEAALRQVASGGRMEWTIVRPPLVHGPGAPGNIERMLQVLSRRIPLPLAAVTSNRRSLVAIDNLIDLLITCLDHPGAANQTFLVSDADDLSTAELLTRLGRLIDKPARLFSIPVPMLWAGARLLGKTDAANRLLGSLQVDIAHTVSTLGWTPPISVDEGLRRTAQGAIK